MSMQRFAAACLVAIASTNSAHAEPYRPNALLSLGPELASYDTSMDTNEDALAMRAALGTAIGPLVARVSAALTQRAVLPGLDSPTSRIYEVAVGAQLFVMHRDQGLFLAFDLGHRWMPGFASWFYAQTPTAWTVRTLIGERFGDPRGLWIEAAGGLVASWTTWIEDGTFGTSPSNDPYGCNLYQPCGYSTHAVSVTAALTVGLSL